MKTNYPLSILLFFIVLSPQITAQSIGDYRSAASGNWSSISTWQTYNGIIWTAAVIPPSSISGAINIRNGHTVTVNANTLVDELTIDIGGTLNLASNTLTLDILGLGNLYCNGEMQLNGGNINMNLTNGVVINGTMLWTDGDIMSGTVDINSGAVLTVNTPADKDLQIASIDINSGGIMNWDDGNLNLNISVGGINNSGTINTSFDGSMSGLGTFSNNSGGVFRKTSTGTTTFNVIVTSILGTFKGYGTLNFNNLFLNTGTISPGLSPGIVLVSYADLDPLNYPLLGINSDIDIEIMDGTGPGTGHDQVIKNGDLKLGGTLRVTETGTVPDGVYNIVLVSGSITGNFDNVILPPDYTLTTTASIVLVSKNTSTLPVSLANFVAKKINNTVQLNWQTYNESNSDRFIIERSKPGGEYVKIGEVNAAGTSNLLLNYQFIDYNPGKGINLYRLKQVDKDNKIEYSPVRWIKFDDKKAQLYVFPTVTNDNIFIQSNEKTIVELYTLHGIRLLTKEISNNDKIDLSKYAAGVYVLRDRKDGKTYKIIKR